MRKLASVLLLAVALLLVATVPSDARGRGGGGHRFSRHSGVRSHVFIGVGPGFFYGPYPYWYYPPPYYAYYPPPYYSYYPPPPVVVQEPPVYIEQQQSPPAPPLPPAGPSAYWYYCASGQAYYPNVQTCPEAWIKVPPRAGQN